MKETMHVYEVMAQPVRRRIVEILASGEHYAGDIESVITHEFGVSRSAVQHHLKLLREHEFVKVHDEWPYRSYELKHVLIRQLSLESKHFTKLWNKRIGWRTNTDPLVGWPASKRGRRGHGVDPDDPWTRRS